MKVIRAIGATLAFMSVLLILGSVGACECENITLGQCFLRGVFGLAGLYLGVGMVKYVERG
jgi:hypothetical protein